MNPGYVSLYNIGICSGALSDSFSIFLIYLSAPDRKDIYMNTRKLKFSRSFRSDLFFPLFLTVCILGLIFLSVPSGSMFGSEVDWLCQHVAIADYMRKQFLSSGSLVPDYMHLGGGGSFFNISYYGFLRPDVLLSCFLPHISTAVILQIYAIAEILAGTWLLYFWLRRKHIRAFCCFAASFLYGCSGCMFQAHRQIMFVNYLPFLLLTFFAADNLCKSADRRKWLPHFGLTAGFFMILIHSFYFFPACFVSVSLYLYFQLKTHTRSEKYLLWKKYLFSVALSLLLSMVLLFPTALAVLETRKSVRAATFLEILAPNLTMDSILYSPYGCGLSLICLYCLFLSIRRRKTRPFSLILLCLLLFDICYWILNGTLYVRPKCLIPFLPLILWMTALTIEEILLKQIQHSLPLALVCLVPVLIQCLVKKPGYWPFMFLDALFLLLFVLQELYLADKCKPLSALLCSMVLFITPGLLYLSTSQTEQFPSLKDSSSFTATEINTLCPDSDSRMDILSRPMTSTNYVYTGTQKKSSVYSSVSSYRYSQLFYDILKMPVSIRNRVALNADANPFQEYLMGVRYIQTNTGKIPIGYRILAEKNGQVLAENDQVLPLAYGSTALISEESFDQLSYPENLDTIVSRTIVSNPEKETSYTSQMKSCTLPSDLFRQNAPSTEKTDKKKLPFTVKDQVLLLFFHVEHQGAQDVSITINGIRNCLSGADAPYPNGNTEFTYLLSSPEAFDTLRIKYSAGDYKLSNIRAYLLPVSAIHNPGVVPFHSSDLGDSAGNVLLKGSLNMDQDGYFVTSFVWADGYTAFVDGEKVTPECVNKSFLGFPIKKGAHEITVKFHAPGKTAGCVISLLALIYLLFCGCLVIRRASSTGSL